MKQETPSLRRGTAAVLLLALTALAAMAPAALAAAQVPSDSVLRGFLRTGDYTLEVNGQTVPNAEVYQKDEIPAILILTSALPAPVLVNPRSGSVETVQIMKVAKQKDGTVDLLADAVLAPQGPLEVVDGNAKFTVDGKVAILKVRPSLLGLKKGSDLKAYSPDYARASQAYAPNGTALAALKKEARPVTVRVYFGSWCPHCRQHVPMLLRVEDELKKSTSKIKFEYMGLERGMPEPIVKKLGLKGVPTGIVYYNGKEIGRLDSGTDWDAPETALNRILSGGGKAAKSRGR
jgi:thiol-disulfide isomerase/thioredoxin